ncbi:MAG: TonB-dependent receptor [Tannerellaceae bacterium]|jgi:TonB-linked SusC/RagA family outer membrane protein|nr:TonB-dependent receptor [Tannerellaceae bacterium]
MENKSLSKGYRLKNPRLTQIFRIMRLTTFLLMISILCAFAENTLSQNARVNINKKNVQLDEILAEIESQTDYLFIYNNYVNVNRKVSANVKNKPVSEVLSNLLANTDIDYVMEGTHILLSKRAAPIVQQDGRQVSGTVTDTNGEPIIGANVVEKGTNNGIITDVNGRFNLRISPNATLNISYIGYITREIAIGNQTNIMIELVEDTKVLDEVVVIGYGTVAKKDVTTAVSTVSTKDLDERPVVDAVQAIQGRAAGVHVYMPSGTPGADMVIRVRGTTSITGSNEPLYVVDGVPVSNLNFLSPNDIASLQVLKDASSAAIYGSRAANGVVLITTKQAEGGAKIRVSTQLGFTKVGNQIESLNAVQFKELIEEISPQRAAEMGTEDITDWFNEVYGMGVNQNYQVQVSDGNQKLRYFVSGGYMKEKGVINSTYNQRYNFRASIDSQVRKWLKLGINTNFSERKLNGITTGYGANRGGVVLAVVALPTSLPVYNDEGFFNRNFYGEPLTNPLESISDGKYRNNRNTRLITTGTSMITFLPELNLNTSFSMDRSNQINTNFSPPKHSSDRSDWGSASDLRQQITVFTFDNVLNYKKSFASHNIEAMLGSSWTESTMTRNYVNGTHFKDDIIQTLNVANTLNIGTGTGGTGSDGNQWAIMSYFGRLSYNFNSKYLFSATVRQDGSSRLHPDHRWGTFPSASAAWRISAEEFMQGLPWLDDLKIRAGWGQTGNQSGINEYAYLQRYSASRQNWWVAGQENDMVSISQSNIRNKDLTWETTTQTSIGVDGLLLDGRLSLVLDWYYKYTTDMLMNVSLPAGAAASNTIVRNEGEMSNRGWEITINSRNIARKDFQWDTEFNISSNKNKLEKLQLQQVYYEAQTTDAFHNTYCIRNAAGGSLSRFWGYYMDGVDPQTGDAIYRDINGDGKITASDKTYIGDPNPTFTYGLTNTISYKRFNLMIFIQGSYGNDIFNASTGDLVGMYDCRNQSVDVLRRWRNPGDVTDIPKVGWSIQPSTFFIEDGSYLRLKDISLSYNFKGSLISKLGITRLQPYFTARNLLTLTKYNGMDPEVNEYGSRGAIQGIDWGTYPHSKQYVFGINIEF